MTRLKTIRVSVWVMVKQIGIYASVTFAGSIDKKLMRDLTEFHAKTNQYKIDEPLGHLNGNFDFLESLERSSLDIALELDRKKIELGERKEKTKRQRSRRLFDDELLSFSLFKELVFDCLISDQNNNREYTSGGALYPIECLVFLDRERFKDFPENMPSGVYHVNNNAAHLILVKNADKTELKKCAGIDDVNFMNVGFTMVFVFNMPKSVFKYGIRAYRLALIEVGSITTLLRQKAQELGLNCCESANFQDDQLSGFLDLNEEAFKPILTQHFGV